MTLAELLAQRKTSSSETPVRVFAGCTTIFNGSVSDMSVSQWVKLHPYFNCKIISRRMINNTFVVAI